MTGGPRDTQILSTLNQLTKRELVDLLGLAGRCLSIRSDSEFQELLSSIRNVVPCVHVVGGLGRTDPSYRFQEFVNLVNVTYPSEWVNLYMERGYASVDPILQTHFQKYKTQVWSQTLREAKSPKEKEFMDHARQFGLSQGLTLGLACHQRLAASVFSFAGRSMGEHIRHQLVLEYLMPHLHVALLRSLFPPSPPVQALTLREREVLKWMKEGKTNWEVSQILHVSERTVKFHVQNILVKLGASNRGHAIALGMEHGMIGL